MVPGTGDGGETNQARGVARQQKAYPRGVRSSSDEHRQPAIHRPSMALHRIGWLTKVGTMKTVAAAPTRVPTRQIDAAA